MSMKVALVVMALLVAFTAYNLWTTDSQVGDLDVRLEAMESLAEGRMVLDLTAFKTALDGLDTELDDLDESQQDLLEAIEALKPKATSAEWARAIVYMDALQRFYAERVLIAVDPADYEAVGQRVAELMEFDPMLSAMWEAVLTERVEFSLFNLVLNRQVFGALADALHQEFLDRPGKPEGPVDAGISGPTIIKPLPGDRDG